MGDAVAFFAMVGVLCGSLSVLLPAARKRLENDVGEADEPLEGCMAPWGELGEEPALPPAALRWLKSESGA
jgi:hypothetical protein